MKPNQSRQQNLNERQEEICSTCMQSCQNIAYPILGMIEELGEMLEKLPSVVQFDQEHPNYQHLCFMLNGIVTLCAAIKPLAKGVRHESIAPPFTLAGMADGEDYATYYNRLIEFAKELGDISWMENVAYRQLGFTAQEVADMNWHKLSARKADGTIDGNGDNERTPIE